MTMLPHRWAGFALVGGMGLLLLFGLARALNLLTHQLGYQGEVEVRTYRAPSHEHVAPHRYTGLQYTKPDSWEEIADMGMGPAPAAAEFRIEHGGGIAEVTVTPIAGPAGGLLANVNRWRRQIGMGELKDEAAVKGESIKIADLGGQYFDLEGPNGSTLGAVVQRGNETWFFKMKGPPELVNREKDAFRNRFLTSVRFAKSEAEDAGGPS